MSQIPSFPRFSPIRIALSILLHGTVLLLAVSLRFAASVTPAAAHTTHTVLLAPVKMLPPLPRLKRHLASIPQPKPRAFTAPSFAVPARAQATPIQIALPSPAAAPAPLIESLIPVSLPPPPIVVGKLSSATSAEPIRAAAGTIRASAFGEPTKPVATELARTARASGFGDASVSTDAQRHAASSVPPATAVEIISKPRPLYTEEARRLHIEGEVLLEVLFAASGAARVERVLRGLGHGLDESAAASAASIQFRPAQRAGQPVDQTATVRITFQLAY